MPNFNQVILMGNLTADPELRYLQDGTPVCSLNMAINHFSTTPSGEKKEEVVFVRVTVWRKQAESCAEYLKKGKPILVDGRLKLDQWTDKDGKKRSNLQVVARRVQFLGAPQGRDKTPAESTLETPESIPQPEEDGAEDIPF